jgi:hypothetical protein
MSRVNGLEIPALLIQILRLRKDFEPVAAAIIEHLKSRKDLPDETNQ